MKMPSNKLVNLCRFSEPWCLQHNVPCKEDRGPILNRVKR